MIAYARLETRYPRRDGLGILPFGQTSDPWEEAGRLEHAQRRARVRTVAYAVVYGAPLLGVAVLFASIRTRRRPSDGDAPGGATALTMKGGVARHLPHGRAIVSSPACDYAVSEATTLA